MCVCVCVCVCVMCVCVCAHAHVHACVYGGCGCVRVRACICPCVRACMRMCFSIQAKCQDFGHPGWSLDSLFCGLHTDTQHQATKRTVVKTDRPSYILIPTSSGTPSSPLPPTSGTPFLSPPSPPTPLTPTNAVLRAGEPLLQ